ncbi:MAG: hypothetical protein RIC35_22240 [Marinoscillum sp.]
MTVQDLFITPIYLLILTGLAYIIRPFVTNSRTRKYFIPALVARFFGAIMLGVIYQFYYGGGDTFNYFNQSKWIYTAFLEQPMTGIALLLDHGGQHAGETFQYSQHIWFYRDPHSYMIVKIAGFFNLFTFSTYSSTALLFSMASFGGLWGMFSVLTRKYPEHLFGLSIAILFVPSVVFWGSGILKDTITIGALGLLTYSLINIIEFREKNPVNWIIAVVAMLVIYSIKIYIIICFVPLVFVWLYLKGIKASKNMAVKVLIAPILFVIFAGAGYFALNQISSESTKYSLDNIAEQAAINAYDIRYGWGARTGGDGGYDLGQLDGSWASMIRLMPQAINVSLFRPYLWEVKNPVMLLAALESILTIFFTVKVFLLNRRFAQLMGDPFLVFCFAFSLIFAFAVGVSTFNFGTLMRYKIPLMPFYFTVLFILNKREKS